MLGRVPRGVKAHDTPSGREALARLEGLASTGTFQEACGATFWAQMLYDFLEADIEELRGSGPEGGDEASPQ